MSDLASLMQVSPITAAGMIGSDNAQTSQFNDLKNQELAQTISQNTQMNPLLLDKQRLSNQTLEAQLPGVQAESAQKGLDYQIAQATKDGTISGTNAKNQLEVLKQQDAQRGQLQNILMEGSSAIAGVPPPMQGAALRQHLVQNNINPDTPIAQGWIQNATASGNPAAWLKARAGEIGLIRAQQNPATYAQMVDTREKAAAERYAADKHLEGSKYTADKLAGSRVAAAQARAGGTTFWSAFNKQADPFNKYSMLQGEAAKLMQSDDPQDKADAQIMFNMMNQLKPLAQASLNRKPNANIDPASVGLTPQPPMAVPDPQGGNGGAQPPAPVASRPAPATGRTSSGASYRIVNN